MLENPGDNVGFNSVSFIWPIGRNIVIEDTDSIADP